MDYRDEEQEIARLGFLTWMPRNDFEQLNWLVGHLNGSREIRGFYAGITGQDDDFSFPANRHRLAAALAEMQVHSIKGYKITQKIKAAWAQRKYRASLEENGKKTYNYVMSIQAGEQLHKIAEACQLSITKTLESLIQFQHDHLVEEGAIQAKKPPTPAELAVTPPRVPTVPSPNDWSSPANQRIKYGIAQQEKNAVRSLAYLAEKEKKQAQAHNKEKAETYPDDTEASLSELAFQMCASEMLAEAHSAGANELTTEQVAVARDRAETLINAVREHPYDFTASTAAGQPSQHNNATPPPAPIPPQESASGTPNAEETAKPIEQNTGDDPAVAEAEESAPHETGPNVPLDKTPTPEADNSPEEQYIAASTKAESEQLSSSKPQPDGIKTSTNSGLRYINPLTRRRPGYISESNPEKLTKATENDKENPDRSDT